ncbi:alpha/beta hydrolase [uncultured Salinisphaera sp.]|uniref:alpha/beta hydrolase n=1 Tax=uncultured Salinisphaera sp. TaxID=359372 RepID=UPI0032B30285|tara:strand:- start:40917 stop:42026 length:1110 start_codon:yes stop_codon:yes gene_type:complete
MSILPHVLKTTRRLTGRSGESPVDSTDWAGWVERTGAPDDTATRFDVIHRRAGVALRHYPRQARPAQKTPRTPLVLVPPLSVALGVYDLSAERSLVQYLSGRGFDLYLIDWGRPGRNLDRRRMADYFAGLLPEMLARVRVHSGRTRLSLHGWGGGGHFALCHAAMSAPELVANLVLVATPIDYHHEGAVGARVRRLAARGQRLRRATGLTLGRLPPVLLHAPGWMSQLALRWGPMDASGSPDTAYDEENALRARAVGHIENEGIAAYPGGFIADVIDHLWIDNALATGRLPMPGAAVGLSAVRVPILAVVGQSDQQATPGSARRLADVVASHDVMFDELPCGHVGALTGGAAARYSWPRIADWLIAHEQ